MWQLLRDQTGVAACALRFLILTAARSGEVRGARWSEIDLAAAVWTVPAARMKASREHRVPLSAAAIALLAQAKRFAGGDDGLVFPGAIKGRVMTDVSIGRPLKLLRPDATVHGWRSTFRDWCAEVSGAPREVAEAALAHINANRVEAAYARTDFLERRRDLMAAWAKFCAVAT